jgi:DNA/RNA-binding domain of Phe-tRNA-synthetase-like protein
MRFTITERFRRLFPRATIGVVRGEIAGIRPDGSLVIETMRREAQEGLRSLVPDQAALNAHPHIIAWRQAYQAFGARPKDHRPTHEALARRVIRGGELTAINPIVDVYLANQAVHLLPHGGYNADALTGDLVLDVSPGGERFEPLGGGDVEETFPGEVVYRDALRILTRRWNYRDCDATKITHGTRTFLLMIESPSELIPSETVEAAGYDLAARYGRCFDGRFQSSLLRLGRTPEPLEI